MFERRREVDAKEPTKVVLPLVTSALFTLSKMKLGMLKTVVNKAIAPIPLHTYLVFAYFIPSCERINRQRKKLSQTVSHLEAA